MIEKDKLQSINIGGLVSAIWKLAENMKASAGSFLGLTDVPTTYAGGAGKVVAVNGAENALEFIAAPGDAVDSVNGQTGAVVLDPDNLDDSATTNKFTTSVELSKLAGIEAAADVTDAGNVASAGAEMTANRRSSFQATPDDTHYPTEKLVKDSLDGKQAAGSYAAALGADDNYVTDAQKIVIGNTSGTNTGDNAANTSIVATKLDDFTAPDDNTDLNASTSKHGLILKATAPAAGLTNVVAIENGETIYKNKALFDATVPSTQAYGDAAATGSAVVAARRDHKHAMPAAYSLADGAVTNAKLAHIATSTIKGRVTAATGDPEDLTAANVRTIINVADGATANAKATGAEINTGTDDAKHATPKSIADSNVRSFSSFSNPYKFLAFRNAAANTGNNVFAVIAFDTEVFDTGNNLSAGVFTAPVSGYYQFNAYVADNSATGSIFLATFFLNNSEYLRFIDSRYTGPKGGSGATILKLTANDTVDVRAYANAANALAVGTTNSCTFSGFLVSIA